MQSKPDIPLATRPPTKKIPRAVWIGGAIALGLLALLLCGVAGLGLSKVFNVGPMAGPSIVGKWEGSGMLAMNWEFKADGTGTNTLGPIDWKMESSSILNVDMIGRRFRYRLKFEGDKLLLFPTMNGKEATPYVLQRAKTG